LEIQVQDVLKTYHGITAVDHISFDVPKGCVCGIIGPNGAGKTTLMEIMMGLRKQDSGQVTMQGMETRRDHKKLVYHLGAQLQESELPANIKVKEAIRLQAALFGIRPDIDRLLADFNLKEKENAFCSKLSGGQRQRLFILLAIIHDPEIVFFDELSTGLDPVSRQEVWNYVEKLKAQGKTILVSTHYMQEAEAICDQVILINHGRIVDRGTPDALKEKLPFHYVVSFGTALPLEVLQQRLLGMPGVLNLEGAGPGKFHLYTTEDLRIDALRQKKDLPLSDLQIRPRNFEDYFYYKVKLEGDPLCQ
jgi:ABC-2 type transport system ATP-binding protein